MAILNNSNAITTSGGYDINNSLRFRRSATAYLNRTPASAGNQTTWTWSGWVKRGILGSQQKILTAGSSGSLFASFEFIAGDNFQFYAYNGATNAYLVTTQVFRDPSAWYHIVFAVDTTQATASNRIKIYVNGTQVTAFSTATYPSQNFTFPINNNVIHNIGRDNVNAGDYFDGYLADVNFIDGSQKAASDFGETDTTTGSWKPKAYTGTYGTNGFYLKFSDIATTSGSNAGLGKDFSGNANYWTTNNISVTAGTTYDAMTDSPTLTSATVANYPVISPLTGVTPTGGNLNLSGGDVAGLGTMAFPSTGKWYFEMVCGSGVTTTSLDAVGIGTTDINGTLPANKSVYMYRSNGNKLSIINGGSSTQVSYGATFVNGDVIGVAFDCDADTLTFYKNNTTQGTAFTSILSSTPATPFFLTVYARGSGGTSNVSLNAGQRPFAYTPPTGFVRLNTYNLPDSTIKKGNVYMDATLYTGNLTGQSITNAAAFKPDLVWIKSRSAATDHKLTDSVRGTTKAIVSNSTAAETTDVTGMTAFNTNGFTLGASTTYNNTGVTYVGWQWQAGQSSGSSNTSGTITSTVSVSTTAGFSVVTYTGTGSTSTVGHGLGVAPKMIIIKNRGIGTAGDGAWQVYHASIGNTQYLSLNTDAAAATSTARWNNTSPTSSVFTVATTGSVNDPSNTYVAYCWAEIAGFSKFDSYTGNGSADGTFVYTGFKPKYVLIKANAVYQWLVWDSVRTTYNIKGKYFLVDLSNAEDTFDAIDFVSNGFKIRVNHPAVNTSATTYIYMAFAENPFKNANAA